MDKKMYKYVAILLVLIILCVVFVWISNLLTGGVKLTYEDLESKLLAATKDYIEDYPGVLPSTSNTSTTISSTTLVNGGYINDLSSYLTDSTVVCNGSVEIYLSNTDNYNYVPDLHCGSKYESIKLYDKVAADNEYGVVSGSGLYQRVNGKFVLEEEELSNSDSSDTFEYVFRGDEVNNFVKIDDNYWRIVAIDGNNDMLLIYNNHIQKTSSWDDRYNEEVDKSQGVNFYEHNGIKSRVMESVESFYNEEAILENKEVYSTKTKYLVSPLNLCVGKRSTTSTDISGSIECSTVLEEQYIGLLPAYYYMSASLDDNCDTIESKNCGNYNYLSQFDDYWWLLTANSENTNEAYNVTQSYVQSSLCSYKSNIRPVILLGSRAVYESGSGTEADPYTVKFYE